ncbi:MAG: isopenicillin N synthase family oxygenase [Alphaproteobacteria bacterium]|nr:isopenicillin N synthase family oxygenase [Alphaproteobacteria bacterium]
MTAERPFRVATTDEFPILDIGPYVRGEDGALEDLAAKVRDAFERVGFMMWVNHDLDWDVIDNAFAGSKQFHDLPLDEKMKLEVNEHQLGFVPPGVSLNKGHSVDSTKGLKANAMQNLTYHGERAPDDPKVLSGERFRGMNQWPDDTVAPGFRESQLAYHSMMSDLGYRMLPVVARALEMPAEYFDDYFKDPSIVVRMVKYPAVGELRDDQFGSASHTDAGFMTFLPQSNQPGLQIKLDSGEWVDHPPMERGVIVNSGNILKRWSNDRFRASPHRVTAATTEDRYSLAFFFNPDLDDVIEPVESCCSEDNPPKYEPFRYGDFYADYLARAYSHKKAGAKAA